LALRDSLPRWPRRWSRSLLFIPICTVIVIILLGMLRLNGSSIGVLAENYPAQSALTARPNRSDEFRGRTPLVLRQAANDFAAVTDVGMGEHDTGVLSDLPVKSAGSILKPHSWVYFVVDVERAFSIEWWLTVLGPFLGVYALLAVLTKSSLISALAGLLVSAAPTLTWWTVPSAGLPVLYGGLAVAAFIAALRSPGRMRFVLGAVAGWLTGCFAAILYLPYLVPLALLFGAVALSQLRGHLGTRRPGKAHDWIRLATIVASGAAAFAVGMALYLRDHHAALSTIHDSVYPGHRVTKSSGGSPVLMFDTPFDVFTTSQAGPDVYGTNPSEAASGLMLWLPIGIAGGAFTGFRTRHPGARALSAVMIVSVLFVAWALLPVPDKIGALTGLTSVQGSRLVLPLTVAGALAAGLYVHRMRTDGAFRPSRDRAIVATVAFVFVTGALVAKYTINDLAPPRGEVMLLIAVLAAVTYLILRGRAAWGLGGACALLLFSAVRVNPIQLGLGPLTETPFAHQIDAIQTRDPNSLWSVTNLDFRAVATVMASGVRSVTGVSWYGNPQMWKEIDPTGARHDVWDRFAYIDMIIDETATETQIELTVADSISIVTPTCNGALQELDVTYLVTDAAIYSPCLELIDSPDIDGERFIYTTAFTTPD
jgi:hypothetical protein